MTPDTADQWLGIFKKDDPNSVFVVQANKPSATQTKKLVDAHYEAKKNPTADDPAEPPKRMIEPKTEAPAEKQPWQMSREEAAKDYPGDEYDKAINRAVDLGDLTFEEGQKRSRLKLGAAGKQLWAQTRAEVEGKGKVTAAAARKDAAEWGKLKGSEGFASWRVKANHRKAMAATEADKEYTQALLGVHKERVQEALDAGADVPIEVLRDYPDLLKKYRPEAPLAKKKPTKD